MVVHLVKLYVGAASVEALEHWQEASIAADRAAGRVPRIHHVTRSAPKRADEIVGAGSIYWVMSGSILCRQRIVGIEMADFSDGLRRCLIELDPEIHQTSPAPRRPFQGWRYLEPSEAPADLPADVSPGSEPMPDALRQELARLGLL